MFVLHQRLGHTSCQQRIVNGQVQESLGHPTQFAKGSSIAGHGLSRKAFILFRLLFIKNGTKVRWCVGTTSNLESLESRI